MHESGAGADPAAKPGQLESAARGEPPARAIDWRPGPIDGRLVSLVAPATFEAEQYRSLRHVLESRRGEMDVIAVTSAVPKEGKTTTAINLAGALAQDVTARILLVDADLHMPSLARLVGLGDSSPGLTGAVRSPAVDFEEFVKRLPGSRLAVLPAGPPPEDPHEVVRSPRLAEVIDEARQRYDSVVVDTPPLVPVSDNRVLAGCIDAFLVVVAAHRTPRRLVEEGLRLVDPAKLLGIVFNQDVRMSSEYRGYYGRYGRTRDEVRAESAQRPARTKAVAACR